VLVARFEGPASVLPGTAPGRPVSTAFMPPWDEVPQNAAQIGQAARQGFTQ
jgi:hypothetical protein